MKKIIKIGMICLISFQINAAGWQEIVEPDSTSDLCNSSNNVFLDGETITYKLYYNFNFIWIPAGEVTFNVQEQEDYYFVQALGTTYPSYEWFFKVYDRYEAIIDKETMLPRSSLRDVQEGSYTKYEDVKFDHENALATSALGKTKDKTDTTMLDLGGCVHDLLSVLYYTRNMDISALEKNDKFPVRVYLDQEIFDLDVKYLGEQKKKKIKGLGNFRTIKFQPELIDGNVFKKGTEMKVWISDDDNKIPLMIESPVTVGSVKVVLKEASGLKYNLDSKY